MCRESVCLRSRNYIFDRKKKLLIKHVRSRNWIWCVRVLETVYQNHRNQNGEENKRKEAHTSQQLMKSIHLYILCQEH